MPNYSIHILPAISDSGFMGGKYSNPSTLSICCSIKPELVSQGISVLAPIKMFLVWKLQFYKHDRKRAACGFVASENVHPCNYVLRQISAHHFFMTVSGRQNEISIKANVSRRSACVLLC